MTVPIPESHRDLFERPVLAVLSTLMPDGQPQSSMVWTAYDGQHVLLCTTMERQKTRNLCANPRATLLLIDPDNSSRWIEVRGKVAAITEVGAEACADAMTRRYTGKAHFYGDVYAPERRYQETRVVVKISPTKISLDAIFR